MTRTLEEARAADESPISYWPLPLDRGLQQVHEARTAHLPLISQFAHAWWKAPLTWTYTQWLGVPMMQCPMDLWMYQAVMTALRPRTVIETGTGMGGTAYFFATIQHLLGIPQPQVITIDVSHDLLKAKAEGVIYLVGDSLHPDIIADVTSRVTSPLLITLDSAHSYEQVRGELEAYAPLAQPGDVLIVQDTIAGPPYEAVTDFLRTHPEWLQDELCERYWLTMHSGGWLVRQGGGAGA